MFAGRVSQFTVALAAALALTTAADASTVTYTHDYGNGAGQVDPVGDDQLFDGYVLVSDQNRSANGKTPFFDSFGLGGISGTITELALTLTYSDAAYSYFLGFGEAWFIRSDDDTDPDGYVEIGTLNSKAKTTISVTMNDSLWSDVFDTALNDLSFGFWFAEETAGKDEFKLYSASLAVTYDAAPAPVPLPAGGLLLLGALGGFAALARRKRAA